MIIIYTGHGKGKTCACIGQALRACGHGMKTAFAQFIKKPGIAGEQQMLEAVPNLTFLAGGLGFCKDGQNHQAHRQAALATLAWAIDQDADMTIMDEAIYALHYKLLHQDEVEALLPDFKNMKKHIVLSGRYCPDWLAAQADLITRLQSIRHPFQYGTAAMPGIEY